MHTRLSIAQLYVVRQVRVVELVEQRVVLIKQLRDLFPACWRSWVGLSDPGTDAIESSQELAFCRRPAQKQIL